MDMSILRQGSNGIFIPLQDQSFHSIENSEISQPNSQFSDVQPMIQPPVPQNQIVANQLPSPIDFILSTPNNFDFTSTSSGSMSSSFILLLLNTSL